MAASASQDVSKDLLDAVHLARPKKCRFFNVGSNKRGCRKGRKCPFRHDGEGGNANQLPHISRCETPDGATVLVLRPPLPRAWDALFNEHNRPKTVHSSRIWKLDAEFATDKSDKAERDNFNLVTYVCQNMKDPDVAACRAAEAPKGLFVKGVWKGESTKQNTSSFLLHSSDAAAGVKILLDGKIDPSDGIAGRGVYCFECEDDGDDAVKAAIGRASLGGYFRGCALLMRRHGILINHHDVDTVPDGCCAWNKDQISASPSCLEYVTVTFLVDALVHSLGTQLDETGYTQALHTALRKVTDTVDRGGQCGLVRNTRVGGGYQPAPSSGGPSLPVFDPARPQTPHFSAPSSSSQHEGVQQPQRLHFAAPSWGTQWSWGTQTLCSAAPSSSWQPQPWSPCEAPSSRPPWQPQSWPPFVDVPQWQTRPPLPQPSPPSQWQWPGQATQPHEWLVLPTVLPSMVQPVPEVKLEWPLPAVKLEWAVKRWQDQFQ